MRTRTLVSRSPAGSRRRSRSAGTPRGGVTRARIVFPYRSIEYESLPKLVGASSTRIVSASRGSCPATGVLVVGADGKPTGAGKACPESVPSRQDAAVAALSAGARALVEPVRGRGQAGPGRDALPVGSKAYWSAQESAFDARVKALTRRGARLVAVQIERSGRGMATRCTPTDCGPLLYRLVHGTALQDHWNAFLAGHHGPTVFSISLARFVCHDAASPCDDRLADGTLARPDGTHYSDEAAPRVAARVVTDALRVSGLARSG